MHLEFSRDKKTTFPAIESPEQITSLRVWHCRYATLLPIADLSALEMLEIATFPDPSLDVLGAPPELRYLRILHLPHITTLEPLRQLSKLETLSLATTPGWDASGKKQIVDSLLPLAQLPMLKHLELFGVVPRERSLSALHGCKGLVSARFSKFPVAEVERFRRATGASDAYAPSVMTRGST